MTFELRDGVAVITGAAGGIGAALAQALAARGCHLALVDRDAAGLAATALTARSRGIRASEHVLDVSDHDAIARLPEAVLREHGRATILVNNAGVALGGRFDQIDLADFEWLMSINFWGTVRMTHAFMPVLARQPAARIVNISSVFGIVAPPGQSAYSASKFAVRGFSESLRHELQDSAIGVTLVHPGGVRTSIAANARAPKGIAEDERQREQAAWSKLLTLSAEAAAARIVQGIERREARVLVGKDARQMALVQRLFPVGYWKVIAREIERMIRKVR